MRKFISELDQERVIFHSHFYKRSRERPIDEGLVRKCLSDVRKLEKVERGNNGRFKLWFFMSRKYSLILIVEIAVTTKILKVVSAWNSDKKWQRKLRL